MTPLSIATFWGYVDMAKLLLEHGADINVQNTGTKWTPLHCAAFQGHGPVIMILMAQQPNLTLKDAKARTAADFASALDSIWPFFLDFIIDICFMQKAAGCRRTPKSELIRMDIVQKLTHHDPSLPAEDLVYFSRPGSAYGLRPQRPTGHKDPTMEMAAITGDVLASLPEEPSNYAAANRQPHLLVWDN
ncbi:hypothetical protein LSH36_100g05037 [Paralvinella palmiformis]|uniref:Uncharacterized protein n=1 Tax=Paralvinella palmiformis TaxID=53620 RepID=A0AAD9JZG5_9ANNE|nr:hypothetical protein LSH36_100g05037 [Paralvinella palmiformis]